MRFGTRLGITGLLIGAILEGAAVWVPLPLRTPPFLEAATSIELLAWAFLATGIVALCHSLYKYLRGEAEVQIASERIAPPSAVIPVRPFSIRAEFLLVLGIVAVVFAINFATAEIYPMAWLDEAGYADPGVNLAVGNGFTSSVWYNVYWGNFWFAYPPLYALLLASWIRWLGVNFTTIRLFNVAVISVIAIALWHYSVRSGWFSSLFGRVAIVLLPLLGYGASFTYRSARADTVCILVAALALNASLLPNSRWRAAALIAVGVLVPWSGLQLGAFVVVLALLVGIWWPREAIRVFLPLGVGMALGLVALFGFYAANGSLHDFLAATFGSLNTIVGQIAHLFLLRDERSAEHFGQLPALVPTGLFEDRSTVFVATAAILLLIALRQTRDAAAFKASRFAVVAAFVIPIFMELAGNYWLYYTWMGLLTVGIAVVASLELSPPSPTFLPTRRLSAGCIGLALLVGLPVQLARAYEDRDARDYDALRAYIESRVAPGDWVYVTDQAYFAVVERGAVPIVALYATSRLAPGIPEDQRRRIKLLIVHPDEVKGAIERLGGSWARNGPAFSPPQPTHLAWAERQSYQLVAYRQE
jgi:hypothetical protein